jgi:glyoxylase-like metal-dependent hydrolase (beta-lactamase superfamily II)
VRIGEFDVMPVSDGAFRVDGGAMFGTVPKVLWQKRASADEANRVLLGLNALIVRRGHHVVLIDAGIGDKLSVREREIFAVDRTVTLESSLAELGIAPSAVDVVIATHLHLDHVGGLTRLDRGQVVPRFPNARHVVRRGEWEDATHPHARSRASYRPSDFLPLAEAGLVDFIEHDGEVLPGLEVWRTGGHTRHHQVVRIASGGQTALYLADLVPTAAHLDPAWVMGYDLYPVDTLTAKLRWLSEAERGEYVIFFEHDPVLTAGILRRDAGRLRVEPVAP